MDILLSDFVNKNINSFNESMLIELEKFLNFEDEIILNYYHNNIVEKEIDKNGVSKMFRGFFILMAGEGGIRTHGRSCPVCWTCQGHCWPTRSATSPLVMITYLYYTIKANK